MVSNDSKGLGLGLGLGLGSLMVSNDSKANIQDYIEMNRDMNRET